MKVPLEVISSLLTSSKSYTFRKYFQKVIPSRSYTFRKYCKKDVPSEVPLSKSYTF